MAANRSHFVEPPPAQLSLEEVLPPISTGVPSVAAARQYTTQLRSLWPTDDAAVALNQAYRLLDVDALTAVVLAAMTLTTAPDAQFHARPSLRALMPDLRSRAWQELLGGRLAATGIKDDPVAGKRIIVPSNRLRLLEPNWARSELHLDGHAVVFAAEVERVTPAAPKPPRRRATKAEIWKAMPGIVATYPTGGGPPNRDQLKELLEQQLSARVTRDLAEQALHEFAPKEWVRERGRPVKKSRT
jgi:hypothetical protein